MNSVDSALTLGQIMRLLSPELVLLAWGLLILGLDALLTHREEKRWLPYVTLLGLAGALVAAVLLWGSDEQVLHVLVVDDFALAVKAIAMVAMMIVVLSSDVYIRTKVRHQGEFYALLIFSALAISLLGASTNLVMIFLTFDFLSICSYILTAYLKDDRLSTEAGVKYFLYGAALSAVMLYGLSFVYGLTGATDLEGVALALLMGESVLRPLALSALIMVLAGFGFKIGAVPFHQWAPDAYEGAPTPVTAFLSVGTKIAGFALILRVTLTMLPGDLVSVDVDWQALLMSIAAITMTVGNLVALLQTNVKRLFAYSSIAQAGYILIGVVAASELGVTSVLLYLLAYAFTNLGAFAVVIAFSNKTGSDEIDDYAGLHKRAPAAALIMLVCLLSLAGIPPTAGFVGKLYLFSAALEQGFIWLTVVAVINSVISLSYYWKVMRAMYLLPSESEEKVATTPALGVAAGIALVGVLLIGVFPAPLLGLLQVAAQALAAG